MAILSRMDLRHAVLLLLFAFCVVSSHACLLVSCLGTVVPESPVLEIGKKFTATCVLSEHGLHQTRATADDIYWEFGNVTVDRQFYTKINESASSLTVTVTRNLVNPLKCSVWSHMLSHRQPRIVHGIFFSVGYPPEKPTNLSCIVNQDDDMYLSVMNCTWDPGAVDYLLETTYKLHVNKVDNESVCLASKTSGTVRFETPPFYVDINVWVTVENKLNKTKSEELLVDVVNIIKPSPPYKIRLTPEKLLPKTMMIQWDSPLKPLELTIRLHYIIRFCVSGSNMWNEVPPKETAGSTASFRLQDLKPFTSYVVQMSCRRPPDDRYWSNWSMNVTARTPEDTPSSEPDVWREIVPSEGNASRLVRLLWKEPIQSNGMILGYNVTIKRRGHQHSIISEKRELSLPNDATRVTVTAYNSVGVSPQAVLTVNKEYPLSVESVDCFPQDGKLMVKWQLPKGTRSHHSEFVIEWVSVTDREIDWQKEPRRARNTTLKGHIQPFKCYNISVYPVFSSVVGPPHTVQAYLKQKAPSQGPVIKVTETGKHEVHLEWSAIPLDYQNGFITGYTIFYSQLNVENTEKSVSLGPEKHSYVLDSLSRNTRYVLRIMASTTGGSTNSSDFTFSTSMYGRGEMEAIVVSVCIGFLFLTVMVVAVCINKHTMIKKRIWPQVPDPSHSTIANWTPAFPTKPETPKEGSMTDVSVVEVDVFDKPVGEEERASLHLKKDKYMSDEHSSGIGGSSCMSSPRQSVSDCDEGDSGQTTGSTVQYSSVVASGYKGQTPSTLPPTFARSESTQPLLDSEERPEDQQGQDSHGRSGNPYFKRPWAVDEDGPAESTEHAFCPVEDTSQPDAAVMESLLPDETTSCTHSYMAQASGYRPQ